MSNTEMYDDYFERATEEKTDNKHMAFRRGVFSLRPALFAHDLGTFLLRLLLVVTDKVL